MRSTDAESTWASWGKSIKLALARRDRRSIDFYLDGMSHEDRAWLLARCDNYARANR